jgi:hypothetical protein
MAAAVSADGPVSRRDRLSGLIREYCKEAA